MGRPRKTQEEKTISVDSVEQKKAPKHYHFVSSVEKRKNMSSYEKIEEFAKTMTISWKREQEKIKNKFSALNVESSEELDLIDEKIADAIADFDNAWYDIPETALETKEAQRLFMVTYENNIDAKLKTLTRLESQKQETIKKYESQLNDLVKELEELERRINKISQ